MSDSQPHQPFDDDIEESPSSIVHRSTSEPQLDTTFSDKSNMIPEDAKNNHHARHNSTVSRTAVGFFDPSGVQALRRTMTRESVDNPLPLSCSSGSNLDDEHVDFEKMIRQIIRRRDDAQIKSRTLGVVFRNLRVVGIAASHPYISTLGSLLNPFVMLQHIQNLRHPKLRNILSGFEGVVKPGEMLLVLGNPGSGCSTFLKTLSSHTQQYQSVFGDIYYDSIIPAELKKHFRGDVQYCPENDIHFPTLSVQQTVEFAATSRTPRARTMRTRKEFANFVTTMLATIFGLRHVMKTPVGDNAVRGVSGGEKKRVSIAEALASRSCVGTWDNSTRGLDSSTALEFVRALRIAADTFESTTIVSFYQAGDSLYNYFDKVCVIYEGRMAYFGPANKAKQYFLDMGYEPADRQTTADFIVAITHPKARKLREGFSNQPRSADEFAEYFLNSPLGKVNRIELEDYLEQFVGKPDKKHAYIESAHAEYAKRSWKASPYLLSISQQIAMVMRRRVQIIKGKPLSTGLNLFSFVFQGAIIGSVFLNSKEVTSAYFSRGGVLFFALLFSALTTLAEVPSLFSQRPIVLRHQQAAFYHPFVEALAYTLVDVPITFLTTTVFSVILYFMVGLQRTADQFFIFLLFLFLMNLTMKGWFRAIAAFSPSRPVAQGIAGVSVLALANYTGFTVPKSTMVGFFRWITYVNPLKYGFEVLMTNEFHTLDGKCSNLVPRGPPYANISLENQVCTTVGSLPGEASVDGNHYVLLSFGFKHSNTWMNFGIIIAFLVVYVGCYLMFTEVNTSFAAETSVTLYKRGSRSKEAPAEDKEKINPIDEKAPVALPANSVAQNPDGVVCTRDIFSWTNLTYTVPIHGEPDKQLLSNISGYVAPGKLTALMGESGAGKTTLLNVLAQRTDMGIITGHCFVNGHGLPVDFLSQSAYCQQMDTHVPFSTVREALLFSAKLRQPASVPLAEKEAYVERCLSMCGLEDHADASIGSLNIEHRKRTTIGVELAAKPKLLLFLDEPTSGLDSQSAWSIMNFLRSLADSGQAILCTIHQPSAELFQVFDRILLLKKGGETVYFDDIGHNATTLIHYFEKNGARPCLPLENPAEYMLDVIGAGATTTSDRDWYGIWKKSSEIAQLQQEIEDIHAEGRSRPPVQAEIHTEFATSWIYQVKELFQREVDSYWRDPHYLLSKLVLNAIGGLFIGITFYNAPNSQQGTQNKLFAIFMATIVCVPSANQLQVPFIDTRNIYEIRERPSRMYSWTALLTAQIMIEVPWNIVGSTILFLTLYWTVGFDSSRAGYTYLMMGVLLPFYSTTFGQAVASMAPSPEIAALIYSFLFSFVITFNGVVQPYSQLGWWQWMYHLSPYTYLIEGILGQAIGQQEISCSAVEFVKVNPPSGLTCEAFMAPYMSYAGGYLANPTATTACKFCSVRTTDEFLALAFNISYGHHWRDFGIFLAFGIFNIFLIFLFTYLFRIHTGSFLPSFLKRKKN